MRENLLFSFCCRRISDLLIFSNVQLMFTMFSLSFLLLDFWIAIAVPMPFSLQINELIDYANRVQSLGEVVQQTSGRRVFLLTTWNPQF